MGAPVRMTRPRGGTAAGFKNLKYGHKNQILHHILYIKNCPKEILIYNNRRKPNEFSDALTSYTGKFVGIMQEVLAKMQRVQEINAEIAKIK